jgi:hypothetical protein
VHKTDDLVAEAEEARLGGITRGREAVVGIADVIASMCALKRENLQRRQLDLTCSQLVYWIFLVELAEHMLKDLRFAGPEVLTDLN